MKTGGRAEKTGRLFCLVIPRFVPLVRSRDGATTLLLLKRPHFADTLMEMFEFREMKLEVNL